MARDLLAELEQARKQPQTTTEQVPEVNPEAPDVEAAPQRDLLAEFEQRGREERGTTTEGEQILESMGADPVGNFAGDIFGGTIEPIQFLGGNFAGQLISGLEMIGRAPFQGMETAIQEGEQTQRTIADLVAPRTEAGKQGVETLGDAVDLANKVPAGWAGIANLIATGSPEEAAATVREIEQKGFRKFMGDKTLEETNSPFLATMVEASPELAGAWFTGKQALKARQNRKTEEARENLDIAVKIQNNEPDADLGRYRLAMQDQWRAPDPAINRAVSQRMDEDPNFVEQIRYGIPRAQKNTAYNRTSRQEWDDGLLNMVSASTGGDIEAMKRMLRTYKDGQINPALKTLKRPIDEAGETIQNYVSYLVKEKQKRGRAVGEAANSLRGEKVPHEPILDAFIKRLEDDGVVFNGGEPITDVNQYKNIDFRNSPFEGSQASEDILRRHIEKMAGLDFDVDGFNLHTVKVSLPNQIATAKKKTSEGGLDSKAEIYLNDLRRSINQMLGEHSEQYRQANRRFAEVADPLGRYNDAMPRNSQINFEGIDPKKAGLQARKVLSNYSNSVDLTRALNDIATTAQKLGIDNYDDPLKQAIFAINLDKRLGAYADQTFQGLNEAAGARVMGSLPANMSVADVGVTAMGELMRRVRRIDNDRAMAAMADYLDEAATGKSNNPPRKHSDDQSKDLVIRDSDFNDLEGGN